MGGALGGTLNFVAYSTLAPGATVEGAVKAFFPGAVSGSLAGAGLAGIGAIGATGLAAVALRIDLGLLLFAESLVMAGRFKEWQRCGR